MLSECCSKALVFRLNRLRQLFDEQRRRPIFQLIAKLDQQNQKLAQARDLLLPRLMNGEIAV